MQTYFNFTKIALLLFVVISFTACTNEEDLFKEIEEISNQLQWDSA